MVAVVCKKTGDEADRLDEDAIIDCCRDRLAGFKRPKEVIFIDPDEMPRTPTGKILHRKLREKYHKTGGKKNE